MSVEQRKNGSCLTQLTIVFQINGLLLKQGWIFLVDKDRVTLSAPIASVRRFLPRKLLTAFRTTPKSYGSGSA